MVLQWSMLVGFQFQLTSTGSKYTPRETVQMLYLMPIILTTWTELGFRPAFQPGSWYRVLLILSFFPVDTDNFLSYLEINLHQITLLKLLLGFHFHQFLCCPNWAVRHIFRYVYFPLFSFALLNSPVPVSLNLFPSK